MARSTWGLLAPNQLAQLGAQALATGQVAPGEAITNVLSLGVNPSPAGMLDMTAPNDLYSELGDVGDKRGAKAEKVRQDTTTFRRYSNRYTTKPMEQARAEQMMAQGLYPGISGYEQAADENGKLIFDNVGKQVLDRDRPLYDFERVQVDNLNPVRQQMAGVDRMEDLLKMEVAANQKRDTMDWSPLAALADAVGAQGGRPSNLAGAAKAPEDRTSKFMAYADDIQKRRGDVQKSIAEGVKNLRGGSTMDQLVQAMLAKDMAGQSNPTRDYQQIAQDRMDYMAHQRTVQAVRNDKNLRDRLVQYQNIQNALGNLANADVKNPAAFDELQQAVRSNLGIKGTSGVSERERTYLNSLGLSWDRLKQIVTGKPADMGESGAEFMKHVQQLANLEQQNIQQQYRARLNAVAGGNASMYGRRPDYQADLDLMLQGTLGQLTPNVTKPSKKEAPKGQAQKAAERAKKPMSIDEFFQKGGK